MRKLDMSTKHARVEKVKENVMVKKQNKRMIVENAEQTIADMIKSDDKTDKVMSAAEAIAMLKKI